MPNKRVEIEVGTDVEDSEVDALEKQIQRLKQERLQFQIDTNTSKLEEVRARIRELENQKATLDVDADDSEIQKIDSEIEQLKFEEIDLDLKVRQDGLQQAGSRQQDGYNEAWQQYQGFDFRHCRFCQVQGEGQEDYLCRP